MTLIQPEKINQLYEAKALDSIPMCPRERLIIVSNTTDLSFAEERIGPLAAIIIIVFIYSHFIYLHYQKNLKIHLEVFTEISRSIPLVNTVFSSLGSTLLFI